MNMTFHLLIVDDNPADISLAREGLAAAAYSGKIESVGDGLEALAFLNRKGNFADATKPDLVILDLNLPKRDGLSVLAAMKAGPDLRKIPVVIFSSSQLGRDIARSYELGANCYISKPGNLRDYFSTMRAIQQFWFGSASLPPRGE
ncbi:MAG: response regulator [Candidatus Sulfotelmatobacter sp.]|jgi:chemotaxis family two-component system response regulator Rcp1